MKFRYRIALLLLMMSIGSGCQRTLAPDVAADNVKVAEIRLAFGQAGGGTADVDEGPQQEPTGWATLRGVFKLDGAAPSRAPLPVTKDVEVCAPGGRTPLSEAVLVGPDGGLKNVLLFLSRSIPDTEPWTHASAQPGKTDEVIFDQKECIFLSHVLAMQATQPLKILNSDPVGHNTNLSPDANPSFSLTIPSGGSSTYQPNAEERQPFSVICNIHPWMQAWIITRKNSYFAVTQEDGSFEIPNLPAGVDLEFRVWQEKSKFVSEATINGTSQTLPKGRLVLNLNPGDDATNQYEVAIPAAAFQ
jgi:hypothetical protein